MSINDVFFKDGIIFLYCPYSINEQFHQKYPIILFHVYIGIKLSDNIFKLFLLCYSIFI